MENENGIQPIPERQGKAEPKVQEQGNEGQIN